MAIAAHLRNLIRREIAQGGRSTQTNVTPTNEEEWVNPIATDPDGIKTSFATAATAQTFTTFNGALAGGPFVPPRNIVIALDNHADHNLGDATIVGTDINGRAQTEVISCRDNGNATEVGLKAFKTVTSITHPAGAAGGGLVTYGIGSNIGLAQKLKYRQGAPVIIKEIVGGSVVTNGVFATPAVGAPNGTYLPNTIPDASVDYALIYEVDPT